MLKGAIFKKGVQQVLFNSFVMIQFSWFDHHFFPTKKHFL